jgi:signal transduction histidine kinase
MRLRHTSIRQRMLLLVLVPLTALVLVYGYAVAGQVSTARGLANAGQISGTTITPVTDALTALNAERTGAVLYLASRSPRALAAFQAEAAAANHEFRLVKSITKSGPVTANATPLDKEDAARFVADGDAPLQALRGEVASGSIGRTAAINAYSAIMAAGLRVAEQSLQETFVSQSLASTARQEVNLYTAEMLALQENDIYSGDVMAGQLPAADQKEFAQLASLRQFLVADATPQLDSEASTLLRREVPASLSTALTGEENAIIAAPAGSVAKPPVALKQWQATAGGYGSRMAVVLTRSPAWIQSQVKSSARRALTTLIVAAGLGLLLVLASVLFSLLMGRRLMRRLNGLREAALELAHERLPQVMARLRDGETVEVDTEAPAVEGGVDEIDQVHQAFNTVHRAAVAAAVDETNLRRGINQVFRNLARRSQVLLHRQLGVLDGMERRAEEPDQLEDLFRIDHLTTRMRRHAEGLIVLAGDTSGRGWRQPVRFVDVLRAAVAEVEDYTRVRVEVHSKAALAGPAVADVVHLLAELIENAAVYSPPTTVVRVQGEVVGRGFCVEVEDRGLGMPEDQLAEINDKLASVPAFDLAGSDRLGLFVAGRLAHRHDISVALRTSVYGGTSDPRRGAGPGRYPDPLRASARGPGTGAHHLRRSCSERARAQRQPGQRPSGHHAQPGRAQFPHSPEQRAQPRRPPVEWPRPQRLCQQRARARGQRAPFARPRDRQRRQPGRPGRVGAGRLGTGRVRADRRRRQHRSAGPAGGRRRAGPSGRGHSPAGVRRSGLVGRADPGGRAGSSVCPGRTGTGQC